MGSTALELTSGEEVAEERLILVGVQVRVAPEQQGWRCLGHEDTLLMGRLVQELIGVVLIGCRNHDKNTSQLESSARTRLPSD